MRTILIALIAALLMTTACLVQPITCPDGSTVMKAEDCPTVQQAQDQLNDLQDKANGLPDAPATPSVPQAPTMDEQDTGSGGAPNPALVALLDKAKAVKSYQFGWAPIEENSGKIVTNLQRTYYVRDDKAKVTIPLPNKFDPHTFAPFVYLDYATKTARGWCTISELRDCSRDGEERTANFNDYVITLPPEWIDRIPTSAALQDGQSFYGRPTKRVEFQDGDIHYQVLLDSFYGMPVRVGAYSDDAYQTLIGGVEYQGVAFNTVTPDLVAFPGDQT